MENQFDRITQILQSRAVPQINELSGSDRAGALMSAISSGKSFSDVYRDRQQELYNQEKQYQADELGREMGILDVFERKKAAGDAQAQALDAKIKLFTGDDPEGMAVFLQALNDDPEEIDAGNSYQVMTKLAGIAKRTGYKSPQMRQKEQMDSVNNAIMSKLGGKNQPLSVRNNNPGNMRPVGQGEGFQAFESPQEGLRAMEADLTAKITGKSPIMKERYGEGYQPTLQSIIETWAPPTENDTAGYVNFVAQKTGIQPNQVLSPMDIQKLIPAMIEKEGGKEASQYYQPVQTADSGQIMNDGVDEITQLQVMSALASGDQAGALKIMADAQEKSRKGVEPSSPQGKLAQDYARGLLTKEEYDKASKSGNLELDKLNKGKEDFEKVLGDMSGLLDELDSLGGIVNQDKNAIMNTGRMLANTEGGSMLFGQIPIPGGQDIGRTFGTKEQTIRDKIDAKKKLLSRAIMAATGMSAKQMDSNTELKMFLNSLGNPTASYQSNKEILKSLSQMYGFGKVAGNDMPTETNNEMSGWSVEEIQ